MKYITTELNSKKLLIIHYACILLSLSNSKNSMYTLNQCFSSLVLGTHCPPACFPAPTHLSLMRGHFGNAPPCNFCSVYPSIKWFLLYIEGINMSKQRKFHACGPFLVRVSSGCISWQNIIQPWPEMHFQPCPEMHPPCNFCLVYPRKSNYSTVHWGD